MRVSDWAVGVDNNEFRGVMDYSKNKEARGQNRVSEETEISPKPVPPPLPGAAVIVLSTKIVYPGYKSV